MIIALSQGCHFCSESAAFYKRLAQATSGRKDVRLMAVFPQQPVEGKAYLSDLGVAIEDVTQAPSLVRARVLFLPFTGPDRDRDDGLVDKGVLSDIMNIFCVERIFCVIIVIKVRSPAAVSPANPGYDMSYRDEY